MSGNSTLVGPQRSATNGRGFAPSASQRANATPQARDKRRRPLAAPRIQVGATERATGGECAHALTAPRTDMRSNGSHVEEQTTSIFAGD